MEKLSYDKLLAPPYDIKLISQARRNPITYSRHVIQMRWMLLKLVNYITEVINRCFVAWAGVKWIIRP